MRESEQVQEENKAGRRAGIWGRAPGRAREGGVGGVVRRSGEDQIPRRENSMCKGPGAKVCLAGLSDRKEPTSRRR